MQLAAPIALRADSDQCVKVGRPSVFSQSLAEDILSWIARGRSLNSFCRQPGRPNISTVIRWLDADPAFARSYARAREMQADALIDEILDIADDFSGDAYVDAKGKRRVDHEAINRSRLRVDARFRLAAAMHPRKYGAKLNLSQNPEDSKTRAELMTEAATLLRRYGFVQTSEVRRPR